MEKKTYKIRKKTFKVNVKDLCKYESKIRVI